ncbi:hypothetical protein FD03_GL000923 [Companilactobacillus nodensis DSM 19682 = JCM 14932 = NBRC 107160]|uniref:DUF3021 domain-containing protein n=3 Tax=Companilactobacillus nodensis TaxID=460870 RepID=A0A0R1KNB8_9LACO|nr:hypothetical protein FD03_GL000923 [Companilactobacillus nodensis DSM 19682 = JCM 14932 = NBRC 107160]
MVITIIIVGLMMFTAGWQIINHKLDFIFTVVIMYAIVWLIMYLSDIVGTKKINEAIRKRKSK